MANERRAGRGLGVIGMLLVIVGIAGGITLYTVSQFRYADAVESMVQAPVGCDTTLEFTRTGTFVVFVETEGTLRDVAGDCAAPATWSRDPAAGLPDPEVRLFDADGTERRPDPIDASTYETDDATGTSVGAFEIATTGPQVVRVTSDEVDDPATADFVVTIGLDPDDEVAPVRTAAIAVGLGGVGIGLLLLVVSAARSRRARSEQVAVPAAGPTVWTPAVSPPVAPPAPAAPVVPPAGSPGPAAGPSFPPPTFAPPPAPPDDGPRLPPRG